MSGKGLFSKHLRERFKEIGILDAEEVIRAEYARELEEDGENA